MGYITGGETFVDGQSCTATRLNAHVANAIIGPGFMYGLTTGTPTTADFVPWVHDGSVHKKVTVANLFSLITADGAANVASLRTIGTGALQAAPGNFLTLSNSFTGTLQTFKHIASAGGAGIAANTALGTTGAATVGSGSGDLAGFVTLQAGGTGITTGTLATATFAVAYASAPWVLFVPYNQNAIALQATNKALNVVASTTGFTINCTTAPTSGTSYQFQYIVAI